MKKLLSLVPMLVAALWAPTARAVPVVEDKEKGLAINVGALIQPTFQMTMSGANSDTGPCGSAATDRCSPGIGNPRGDGPSYDFFIRRARLMLWGSVNKQISFFIDTDEPNLGKGGVWSTSTFVQDAFATYTFMPELRIDGGLMLVPLSHHTLEGATSLNALDYHSDLVRFPTGRIFRDAGIQLRGVALQDHLHYRLGIFEGVRNGALAALPPPAMAGMPPFPTRTILNPGGVPRITAHVRGNILGVEPDFFLKGIYFSKTPIISVGAGYDFQPNSVIKLDQTHGNYMAASGDVFVEYPFTEADELIVKGNVFWYGEGGTTLPGSAMVPSGALGLYGEVGFRHDWIEPVVFIDVLKGNKGKTAENPSNAEHTFQMAPTVVTDIMAPHLGVNFWIMKHNFNIKTDIGYKKTDRTQLAVHNLAADTTTTETKLAPQKDILWTTQMQMFF